MTIFKTILSLLIFSFLFIAGLNGQNNVPPITDTCAIYTYNAQLSFAGGKSELAGMQMLPEGNYLLAVKNTTNPGLRSVLVKMGNNGNLIYSREMAETNHEITFTDINYLHGSGTAIGSVRKHKTESKWSPLVMMLDAAEEIVYTSIPVVAGRENAFIKEVKVSTLPSREVLYTYLVNDTLVYGKLDKDGKSVWSKEVYIPVKPELVSISHTADSEFIIALNTLTQGKRIAWLIPGNINTGQNIPWIKLGNEATGLEYFITDCNSISIYPQVTGTLKQENGEVQIFNFRLAFDSRTEFFHTLNIPHPQVDMERVISKIERSTGVLAYADSASLFSGLAAGGDNIVPNYSKSIRLQHDLSVLAATAFSADGGYLWALNPKGAGESIMLVKTDSTLKLGGCTLSNPSIQYANNNFTLPKQSPYTVKNAEITTTTANIVTTPVAAALTRTCYSNTCPPPDPLPDCTPGFSRKYNFYAPNSFFANMALTSNNEPVMYTNSVVAQSYDPIQAKYERGIVKLNSNGEVTNGGLGYFRGNSAVPIPYTSKRGGIYVVNNPHVFAGASGNQFVHFGYYDASMVLQWGRTITLPQSQQFHNGEVKLAEDEDGNIYVVVVRQQLMSLTNFWCYKFSSTGNLLWQKGYDTQAGIVFGAHITTAAGKLFITCREYVPEAGMILRINGANGNLEGRFSQVNNNLHVSSGELAIMANNEHVFMAGVGTKNGGNNSLLVKTDHSGNALKSLQFPDGIQLMKADIRNNRILVHVRNYSGGDFLAMLDLDFRFIYYHQFNPANKAVITDVKLGSDNSAYVVTSYSGGTHVLSGGLMKIPPNGLLGDCLLPADTPALTPIIITTSTLQVQNLSETSTVSNETFTFIPQTVRASAFFCYAPDNCKSLKITGNTAVCDTSSTYVYRYQKSAGCTTAPTLSFSPDSVLLIRNTPDSFTVKFLQPGRARIFGQFNQGCAPVLDSIFVNVSAGIGAVSIGSDTALCANDTITLTATAGFFSYQWNTGATTQSIRTGTIGQYYVTALSACGEAYSDSLMITEREFPPLLNHGDSIVCISSNVQLEAVAGYTRYEWRNNQGLISSNRVVTATVNQAQRWTISADYFGLCPFMDSLSLTPFAPSVFSLGADSSLCEGQSLTLTAPGWLNNLLWSTGSTANSITVNSSGTYSLQGLDTNACATADTLVIRNVFPNPVVDLGNSGSACATPDYRLDAGVHSAYLWNDGSTGRYLPISNRGTYSVTVKNQQNCAAADTITIIEILDLPVNFLNDTASICRYQTTTLRAIGNYAAYLWNNGATTASITINQAGFYSLTVTNAGGCTATDTIRVQELTCIEGIFIPSAFTPNRDGLNDTFKPIIYADLESYEFMIFTRWGELIFSSKTPGIGWDGTVKGKAMPAGNFVWKLLYKVVGGEEVMKGGNGVLVR